MKLRRAIKIVRLADPARYTRVQVDAAVRRVMRVPLASCCPDCPVPVPGPPRCPHTRTCDRLCAAQSLAMDLDTGRYPWGPWRCAMQRGAGAQ